MYTTNIFEQAMNSCGYILERVFFEEKSRDVRKITGRVVIPKKVTIEGVRKTIITHKKLRWDSTGRCFSLYSNNRKRPFDLPLLTIVEFNKQKELETRL